MAQTIDMEAIRKLTPAQRIVLIEQIWDTLAEEGMELPVSDEMKSEIRSRIQHLKDNPAAGKSHKEIMQWLVTRSRK